MRFPVLDDCVVVKGKWAVISRQNKNHGLKLCCEVIYYRGTKMCLQLRTRMKRLRVSESVNY